MRVGVAITMYDEHDLVKQSINNIKKCFDDCYIVVSHSNDNRKTSDLEDIKKMVDSYFLLSDLSLEMERDKYQSYCVSRNYSKCFEALYQTKKPFSFIVAFTGDTLIIDAQNFLRRYTEMSETNKKAFVSQAIGQYFHSPDKIEGRYQNWDTTDFMPQFFIIDGKFAEKTQCFSNIEVINERASEHCLGASMIKAFNSVEDFYLYVEPLNKDSPRNAYHYKDGIIYHAKNGRPGR